jgi:hypothetical protein
MERVLLQWIMVKHMIRGATKPYYIAVAETTADLVYRLIPAVEEAGTNPARAAMHIAMFDRAFSSFANNTNRETMRISVEHWATRVASPVSVKTVASFFSNSKLFGLMLVEVIQLKEFPGAGSGLGFFQQALKDNQIISILTLLEENATEFRGDSST